MCVVAELEQTRRCSSNNHNYHPNQNFNHDQEAEEEKLKQMPQTSGSSISSNTTECPVLLTILHLLTSNLLLALVSTIILSLVGGSSAAAVTVVTPVPCRRSLSSCRTKRITTTSIRTTLAGGSL